MRLRKPENLLRSPRFWPLFLTQFLGAFNDNVFKNALLLLVTYHSVSLLGQQPAVVVQIATGLFILPFFLFSAMAGQIADKFEKARLIRIVKAVEIGIALVATLGFYTHQYALLLVALFLMGVHSSFFGPLKYSILPQHLRSEELVAGNAWVESGTFLAILLGTVVAGLLIAIGPQGPVVVGAVCTAIAVAGYLSSRAILPAPAVVPNLRINPNPLSETLVNLRAAAKNHTLFHSMMGISWFWFYGAIFLTQFAPYVKDSLGGDELLATALLATFIFGIALGSFLCERASGKHVEIGLVPLGSLGLTIFGVDLYFASPMVPHAGGAMISTGAFLAQPGSFRIIFDLVMIGVAGGFYTVPLYALIQQRAAAGERSRMIAANNILNAAFMVVSAAFAGLALACGASIPMVFLITALMNMAVAIYIYRLVPEFMIRLIAWILVHSVYRLRINGTQNVPREGGAVLVCNHVSFVDAIIIMSAIRRPIRFVMHHRIFALPIINFIFRENRAIPIASAKEDPVMLQAAYDEIAASLAAGDLVAIFPEGSITQDGELAEFKNGIGKILARTPVPVLPMALRGLWGSFFSRKHGPAMTRPFRRAPLSLVELAVGPVLTPEKVSPAELQVQVAALRGDWR